MAEPPHEPARGHAAATLAAGATLRAEAARALARIVFGGRSLRTVLADTPRMPDRRDHALHAASLFAATRWWLRLNPALDMLTNKPLPPPAREVRALLVIGLAQRVVLDLPDYAVVATCVEAARRLGQPRYAGLTNAVLRNFLRERAALDARLDQEPITRYAHPRWLIEAIRREWPDHAEAILTANNHEASPTLRVNTRRATRDALLARWRDADIAASAHVELPDAIVLPQSTDVTQLPGYAEGLFSVQDGAAQRVADLLDLRDGQRVLDACAAPGGKSTHILERAAVDLLALDSDAVRLQRVRENLQRLRLEATLATGDATTPATWWDGRPFQRILIDAPCSATGIIRRQPDIKLHRRPADIPPLATTQGTLLRALWPLLAPGGRIVYATCSLLRAENAAVLAQFLAACDDARAVPLPERFGHAAGIGRQRLPGEEGMDGFFYAVLEKIS
ncbi:MAG: 16S rRNA (cytosine(967)-C(5))-methyltransferase RsmB [Rhodanobacter sp.]|jgi:16S rRNA (cytosine967-C5)-methyltransferase|nr:16S rRNA (cytosine(967)-C(5))-methyltransferase RsmB [Rhodanobacter sp.]